MSDFLRTLIPWANWWNALILSLDIIVVMVFLYHYNKTKSRNLLTSIESGRQAYRQTQQNGYDFRSAVCSNPCLTCIAANMLLNCCLGGCGRYGMFC